MVDDGPDPYTPTNQPLDDAFRSHADAMVAHLNGTKPWARFLAILGFIAAGFMAVVGVIMLVASPFMDAGPVVGPVMSVVYMLLAVLYVVPCLFLNRYASAIGRISRGGGPQAMAEALDQQRRFWRIAGILTLVALCFYILAIGVGIVVGVMAAMGAR